MKSLFRYVIILLFSCVYCIAVVAQDQDYSQNQDYSQEILIATLLTSQSMENSGDMKQAELMLDYGISFLDSIGALDIHKGLLLERKARLRFTSQDYVAAASLSEQACSLLGGMEQADLFYLEAECLLAKSLFHLGRDAEMREVLTRIGTDNNKANSESIETAAFISIQNHIADLLQVVEAEEAAVRFYEWVMEHAKGKPAMHDSFSHAVGCLVDLANKGKDYSRCIRIMDSIEGDNIDLPYEEIIRPILLNAMIEENDVRTSEYLRRYTENAYDNISLVFNWMGYFGKDTYWSVKARHLMQLAIKNAYLHPSEEALIAAYENTVYSRTLLQRFSSRMKERIRLFGSEREKKALVELGMWQDSLFFSHNNNRSLFYQQTMDSLYYILTAPLKMDEQLSRDNLAISHSYPLIRNTLSKAEAAIEFVFIREDDRIRYGALIITKESTSPELVPLAYTTEISELMPADSSYIIYNRGEIYEKIWAPLLPYLKNVSCIYYTTTGQLNQVNFDAIKSDEKILGQQYELYRCSSTSEIQHLKNQITVEYDDAVLYADLQYFVPENKIVSLHDSYVPISKVREKIWRGANDTRALLLPLDYSWEEASQIKDLFNIKSIPCYIYRGSEGNEESFKAFSGTSPSVIHLATHGFFLKNEEEKQKRGFLGKKEDNFFSYDQLMINSGVLLSGSSHSWEKGISIKGVEDGILTAEEISHLDLSGTSLVVLSACETGLGDLDEVEGTLGLVRALKMAGVKTIVMSLWEVEDESTMEMMSYFYRYLLDGHSSQKALKEAMASMRSSDADPRKWASFVIID